MIYTINGIVTAAAERRASDIHIAKNLPIKLRIDGILNDFDDNVLTAEDCISLARQISDRYEEIAEIGELDVAISVGDGIRCRVNMYRERGCVAIAIRLLSCVIPSAEELGLPNVVKSLVKQKQGIILITGQTGSGKSTTLAYLLNEINRTQNRHIITIEEPIEYIHNSIKSMISQREVGIDTRSFQDGLTAALREDPDVIMIGELRTLGEIETALTIAETGHLVLASVHTNSAAETVDRLVDVFPAQQHAQIRLQLSMTLNAVICQQLIPHSCGRGRVLATEVMMMNSAISNLIREGKTPQIENSIATSAEQGSCLMDSNLITLYRQGKIAREEAIRASHNAEYVRRTIR